MRKQLESALIRSLNSKVWYYIGERYNCVACGNLQPWWGRLWVRLDDTTKSVPSLGCTLDNLLTAEFEYK